MHKLDSDAPIENQNEDRLGYWPFAKALAEGIVNHPVEDGFVVGLQAQWGMGKTSAINLVKEAIENGHDKDRIKIVQFSPWLYTSLESTARGYLVALGDALDDLLGQGTPKRTRQFVKRMSRGADAFGGATALGVTAISGGLAGPFASVISSTSVGLLKLISSPEPLDELVSELRKSLSSIQKTILVVIDDLDRLDAQDVRQILTLVKTFGNLPHVAHLLVYDRKIIEGLLDGGQQDQGRRNVPTFLEKIVQVQLDLPPASKVGLRSMFFSRLDAIVEPTPEFDREDWSAVVAVIFENYLTSPRAIIRLLNSLSLIWPTVKGEVHIPDLVMIEAIRHFEFPLYKSIVRESEFLLGRGGLYSDESNKILAKEILSQVQESRRDDIRDLIARFFPRSAKYFTNFSSFREFDNLQGRRIGDVDGFDAYFRFAPPADQISAEILREINNKLDDRGYLLEQLSGCAKRIRGDGTSFAAPLLEELNAIVLRKGVLNSALVDAVLSFSESLAKLQDEVREFFVMTNSRRIERLLFNAYERMPAQEIQRALQVAIDNEDHGISFVCWSIVDLGRPYNYIWPNSKDSPQQARIPEADLHELAIKAAHRIQRRPANLIDEEHLYIALLVWKKVSGPSAPREWIEQAIGSVDGFKAVAFCAMGTVHSSAAPYKYRKLTNTIDVDVFDLPLLLRSAELYLTNDAFSDSDASDIERFAVGVRALLDGKPVPDST